MNAVRGHSAAWRDITPEEHNEAVGFVLDCILANAECDDDLGDSASLRPIKIARTEDGTILAVLCKVRPRDTEMLTSDEQIFVAA